MSNMTKVLAILFFMALTACGGNGQQVSQNPCAPGQPVKVTPMQAYVAIQCDNGNVATIQVARFQNQGYSYNNGNDMLNDPFFWMYMMGPHYASYPIYSGYIHSPIYRSYAYSHPYYTSRYNRNVTINHNYYGGTNRSSSSVSSSYSRSYSPSNSSYRSSSFSISRGGRR